jgi:hypothetical protein
MHLFRHFCTADKLLNQNDFQKQQSGSKAPVGGAFQPPGSAGAHNGPGRAFYVTSLRASAVGGVARLRPANPPRRCAHQVIDWKKFRMADGKLPLLDFKRRFAYRYPPSLRWNCGRIGVSGRGDAENGGAHGAPFFTCAISVKVAKINPFAKIPGGMHGIVS